MDHRQRCHCQARRAEAQHVQPPHRGRAARLRDSLGIPSHNPLVIEPQHAQNEQGQQVVDNRIARSQPVSPPVQGGFGPKQGANQVKGIGCERAQERGHHAIQVQPAQSGFPFFHHLSGQPLPP